MKEQVSAQTLEQKVQQLEPELTPTRDLWPGIEKALVSQQHSRHQNDSKAKFPQIAMAASVVAAVLLTWGVIHSDQRGNSLPPTLAMQMEQDFEQTKQVVLASYGQETMKELPPELKAQFDELSKARAALTKALASDPNNNDLLNLLRWTQQQELSLLQTVYRPKWQSI